MNTKQTNNVTMLKTVDAYLDENTSVWSAMTPLATAIQSLKTKIGDIDIAAQKQQTPSGATDDKAEARDAHMPARDSILEAKPGPSSKTY